MKDDPGKGALLVLLFIIAALTISGANAWGKVADYRLALETANDTIVSAADEVSAAKRDRSGADYEELQDIISDLTVYEAVEDPHPTD